MSEALQTWDPEEYAQNARFVADLAMPLVELLGPQPGERILDLGCGDGYLTAKLIEAGSIVLGVDSSAAQVEAARRAGVPARVGRAESLRFHEEFDAVFSNATLHWVKAADAAIRGVQKALKPSGRFVAELGGEGCVAQIREALRAALLRRGVSFEELDPWYFPSAGEYSARLEAAGFEVASIAHFQRPTRLPGDMVAWLSTFARAFTAVFDPGERDALLNEVQEELRPRLCDSNGHWTADYTRLRFRALKRADGRPAPEAR